MDDVEDTSVGNEAEIGAAVPADEASDSAEQEDSDCSAVVVGP